MHRLVAITSPLPLRRNVAFPVWALAALIAAFMLSLTQAGATLGVEPLTADAVRITPAWRRSVSQSRPSDASRCHSLGAFDSAGGKRSPTANSSSRPVTTTTYFWDRHVSTVR